MGRQEMLKKLIFDFAAHLLKISHKSLALRVCKRLTDLILLDGAHHKTMPGEPKLEKVESTTETAFQRAIFNNQHTPLQFYNSQKSLVEWLDLELPVAFNEKVPRRPPLDLIGRFTEGLYSGSYCVCELKFGNSGDSPQYGIFELLTYLYWIEKNWEGLKKEKVYHKLPDHKSWDWENVVRENEPAFLILAANQSYWDKWEAGSKEIFELQDKLKNDMTVMLTFFSAQNVDNDYFKNQKKNKEFYKPEFINIVDPWQEITKITIAR